MKSYRVRLMLRNSSFQSTVKAYSEVQAASYWAKVHLGDINLRFFVKAEEIDQRFIDDDLCPSCGLRDQMVANGEVDCPNCH